MAKGHSTACCSISLDMCLPTVRSTTRLRIGPLPPNLLLLPLLGQKSTTCAIPFSVHRPDRPSISVAISALGANPWPRLALSTPSTINTLSRPSTFGPPTTTTPNAGRSLRLPNQPITGSSLTGLAHGVYLHMDHVPCLVVDCHMYDHF